MKLTKRQLKQIIREEYDALKRQGLLSESTSHPEKGECPSIYEWEKIYSLTKSMRVSGRGEPTTAYLKAWNRYKKKGMNIPGMLYDETPECAYAVIAAARNGGYEMPESAYQEICDAWLEDATNLSDFDWNYDPDDY